MKKWTLALTVLGAVISYNFVPALAATSSLDKALADNSQAAETLAAYPNEVRQAVLESSLYPDVLFALGGTQRKTQAQFQKMLSPYSRKTQEQVYELSRYPGLMEALVQGGKKSKGKIKDLSQDYPKVVREAALNLGRKEYALLTNIQGLHARSEKEFDRSILDLPSSSQRAFRTLLQYPEVFETLDQNQDLTLALGRAYRVDPGAAQASMDRLSETVAVQNQEAAEEYRNNLQNDPKAQAELQKSAKAFAKEYDYLEEEDYYPAPASPARTTVVNININPYPFWFGYPYWYAFPFWRPYPLWYHTGFYIGPGGGFVAWGPPSYCYTNWFYGYPRNFYYYPYLASYYGNHYYRWRNRPVYGGFYRGVRHWHHRHRHRVHQDLWKRDRRRADRWRDFGHEEIKRRRRPVSHGPGQHYSDRWKKRHDDRSPNEKRPPEHHHARKKKPREDMHKKPGHPGSYRREKAKSPQDYSSRDKKRPNRWAGKGPRDHDKYRHPKPRDESGISKGPVRKYDPSRRKEKSTRKNQGGERFSRNWSRQKQKKGPKAEPIPPMDKDRKEFGRPAKPKTKVQADSGRENNSARRTEPKGKTPSGGSWTRPNSNPKGQNQGSADKNRGRARSPRMISRGR